MELSDLVLHGDLVLGEYSDIVLHPLLCLDVLLSLVFELVGELDLLDFSNLVL